MNAQAGKIAAALVAMVMLAAAKPSPPAESVRYTSGQPTRPVWRSRAVPVCVARLSANRALTPDDLEAICGCAFDTYLDGHGDNPLPGLASDHVPIAVENDLLSCTDRIRPDQRTAVRQLNVVWPQGGVPAAAAPVLDDPKPLDETEVPADAEASEPGAGGGFWSWLGNLTLPAWLTGASLLWWVAVGIFLLGLLILKIRRRDPRNDLVAPPAHMRRGAPPMPLRRPDLPR